MAVCKIFNLISSSAGDAPAVKRIMGWDDALILGGISLAASAAGAGVSYLGNSALQNDAQEYNKWASEEAYARYKADRQYWASVGPSEIRKGLENAGINPILAYGGLGSASSAGGVLTQASSPGASMSVPHADVAGAINSSRSVANDKKVKDASAEALLAQLPAIKAEAKAEEAASAVDYEKAEIELEALKDDNWQIDVNGEDCHPTRTNYRKMIQNRIERERYTGSREHAEAEDAINAIHGINSASSAFSNISAGRRNWYRTK